ncbi:hypothetical protein [Candidatus Solirubrobacter pratensis]|uniref:hypothetical protein n=1 Tax=Candidatus Solirubrobacter pratensis TaxID=1298857 RepID=UPI00048133F8|nr:hypothetical protein [Candidatus Solirubrobacter pratensis]
MSRLPALLITAAALAGAPAAKAAAQPLAVEKHATTVSTYADAIAWSSYDAATGAYRLTLDRAGQITRPAVPPSKSAFDVDLGTSRSGALVAVYSRAGTLYQYDAASGKERRLAISVHGAALSQPTVMAGRIAFVARSKRHDSLRLRTAARGAGKVVYVSPAISDPELSGTRLAFVTATGAGTIRRVESLRVQTLTGTSRTVYQARSGGANDADIVGPGFDTSGKHLLWARRNIGSGSGNRYVRLTLSSGKLAYATGTDKLYSASWIDTANGFATALIGNDDDASAPGDGVTVGTTGSLAFTARP